MSIDVPRCLIYIPRHLIYKMGQLEIITREGGEREGEREREREKGNERERERDSHGIIDHTPG